MLQKTVVIQNLCPYPHVNDLGDVVDGWGQNLSDQCAGCRSHSCVTWLNKQREVPDIRAYVCEFGMVSWAFSTSVETTLVVGLSSTEVGRSNESQLDPPPELRRWVMRASETTTILDRLIQFEVETAVAPLHDLKPAVGMLLRNAEKVIERFPGASWEERLNQAADPSLARLLKTANVLHAKLNLPSFVVNPASAGYGRPRFENVYEVFRRFVWLFGPMASDADMDILLDGSDESSAYLYDSFESIPLLLLENAIKFSDANRTITVRVDTVAEGVFVSVGSYGSVVPSTKRWEIFNRGVRGGNSSKSGTGLGLYIAEQVALAHGTSISYRVNGEADGKGWNYFSFTLPQRLRNLTRRRT